MGRRIFSATGSARTNMSVHILECTISLLNEDWPVNRAWRPVSCSLSARLAQGTTSWNSPDIGSQEIIALLDGHGLLLYILLAMNCSARHHGHHHHHAARPCPRRLE